MDDIKLVELSINAAGWQLKGWVKDSNGIDVAEIYADGKTTYFQPLHENTLCDCMGNALRLAVKLRLSIDIRPKSVCVITEDEKNVVMEGNLAYSLAELTRRSIVIAAAKTGKEMP